MATALKITTQKVDVQLTLTEEEAYAFMAVAARVGGNPVTTRRSLIDNISKALRFAGIGFDKTQDLHPTFNNIWFI